MSIGFVFGPAGSGKSTFVQDELIKGAMAEPKRNFILIVPDQFTMETQMDVVERHPNKGILNIDVLSFGRLSYRVFSETGKADTPVLDDTGKSLVLRRVAGKVAESMPYLGRNLNKVGFIHEVKSQISEFMQYGLSVRDVEKLSADAHQGALKSKLSDLHVIYKAFAEFNDGKFITAEETLEVLCTKIPAASFLKNSLIVFDGFTGFTPIQEAVILKLCEVADSVRITLDLSAPEKPSDVEGEEKLFYLSRKTANRLKTKARDLNIEILDDVTISGENGRFKENAALSHLEANLFRYPVKAFGETGDTIEIFKANSIDDEVLNVCTEIGRLIRSGKYAYRDIGVVCGNLENYGYIFENRMRELDMPVFIDQTAHISLNPFIEFLKSALLVMVKDYSYESVFHYLRSGFTDFDDEEIDRFDRYVLSLNIRGSYMYDKPFKKYERGTGNNDKAKEEVCLHEAVRKRLQETFKPLKKHGHTAKDYVNNLYEFLKDNHSYEKLCKLKESFEAENNLSKAKEYGQIYKAVMELLDTIVALIGDEEMELSEFYRIFEAGIAEIKIGTIPQNVDRIVVGDIERTRLSHIKVLFLVGCNDGNIPKNTDHGGLFSREDRELLVSHGVDMAPTAREEMFTQRLYLYMNLCKPSDKLFVSFACTDVSGKALKPAYLIETLKSLYSNLSIKEVGDVPAIDSFITPKASLGFYARFLRNYVSEDLTDEEKKLLNALILIYKESFSTEFKLITDKAFISYTAKALSKKIVEKLYGNMITASISRMEMYAQCAYEHFLKYGMELREEESSLFERKNLGSVFHGVIDLFTKKLKENNLTWRTFSEEEGEKLIEETVKEYCADYEQGMLCEDEQMAYTVMKITKIMIRTVSVVQFQIKQGSFELAETERSFNRTVGIADGKSLKITGKIDRIDTYEKDGKVYVRIIDYKSSAHDIDITDVYHGLSQQLAIYMAEAVYMEQGKNPGKKVAPSGMFYYKIDNPLISEENKELTDEELDKKIKKELRLKGFFEDDFENMKALDATGAVDNLVLPAKYSDDPEKTGSNEKILSEEEFANMTDYVERLAVSIGERIFNGDKSINPMQSDNKNACEYCAYKPICRLDERIPGLKARDGKDVDKETAREIVLGGDKDGLYLFD